MARFPLRTLRIGDWRGHATTRLALSKRPDATKHPTWVLKHGALGTGQIVLAHRGGGRYLAIRPDMMHALTARALLTKQVQQGSRYNYVKERLERLGLPEPVGVEHITFKEFRRRQKTGEFQDL
jgi:hypothetical protein